MFDNADAAWCSCNYAVIVTWLSYLQICHL